MMPLMNTFSRPEISGWKPAPSSMSAEMRPFTFTVPRRRLRDACHQLQRRALARSVAADDAVGRAGGHVERHALQRRKFLVRLQILDEAALQQRALQRRELFLPRVAAVDLRDVGQTSIAFMNSLHFFREGVAQAIEQEVPNRNSSTDPTPSATSHFQCPKGPG